MRLRPNAREWYALELATEPAVTGWEASFDAGVTWVASTAVGTDGYFRWLVAGPDADPGTAIVLPVGTTQPLVRAVENPEIVVRGAPQIDVAP